MRISVVIPAAGKGRRAGFSENKIFHLLPDGRTVLERAASAFFPFADEVIIAADPAEEERVRALFGSRIRVVTGGKTRTESVRRALEAATGEIVLVHDAARPYVSEAVIRDCIASVKKYGSGIPALPTADTVCAAEGGEMTFSYGKTLFAVQTPQGFYTEDLRRAYCLAKGEYADDSAVYAAFCRPPRLCAGGAENRKLTFAADFPPRYAVGEGFDCHAFAAGRKLVLGGVEIPHDRGLLGHSDADVLTHAVMDALLSAVGEGDIGVQFPDTDPAYRGISSMLLLACGEPFRSPDGGKAEAEEFSSGDRGKSRRRGGNPLRGLIRDDAGRAGLCGQGRGDLRARFGSAAGKRLKPAVHIRK